MKRRIILLVMVALFFAGSMELNAKQFKKYPKRNKFSKRSLFNQNRARINFLKKRGYTPTWVLRELRRNRIKIDRLYRKIERVKFAGKRSFRYDMRSRNRINLIYRKIGHLKYRNRYLRRRYQL